MSAGIDYGMGRTNIDGETGIRYGVIHQNTVGQAWDERGEPIYPEPACPDCGEEVADDLPDGVEGKGDDRWCPKCEAVRSYDECLADDPIGYQYLGDGYKLVDCLGTNVMVLKSPFYTLAKFCSPCVPGAGDLDEPDEDGVKSYCLGHEWFEEDSAPYPVYSVETGNRVVVEKEEVE